MSGKKLRMLAMAGLLLYLTSLLAPSMASYLDIDVSDEFEKILIPNQQEDGLEQLNDVQKKALVDWSRNADSQNSSVITASPQGINEMVIDLNGNLFLIGEFTGTATFGNITLTAEILGSYSPTGFYVAKLNSGGQWEWATWACGSSWNGNSGDGIALDSNGNIYVTGHFGNMSFGSEYANFTSTGGADYDDIFVAKLDSTGSWLWVIKAGGGSYDQGRSIAIDSNDDIYITGEIDDLATFGSIEITGTGNFVAKLDSTGSWLWAINAIGVTINDIAVDSNNNAYLTGFFSSTTTLGGTSLSSNGGTDIFVAKMNSEGGWLWAQKAGGSSNDEGLSITVDLNGNAYVLGDIIQTVTFGSSITLDGNLFVAKLNSSGSWLWAAAAQGSSYYGQQGSDITIDSSGNTYITGVFESTETFGGTLLTKEGSDDDIFVAKLNNNGSWLWATSTGGGDDDVASSIAIHSNGSLYHSGSFRISATLGNTNVVVSDGYMDIFIQSFSSNRITRSAIHSSIQVADSGSYSINALTVKSDGVAYITGGFVTSITIGSTTLTSNTGDIDIYVAKLSADGQWMWAIQAGGENADYSLAIALDSNGDVYISGWYTGYQGGPTFGGTTFDANGNYNDGFVAKIDSDGNWVWAIAIGGSSGSDTEKVHGMVILGTSIYITGEFSSSTVNFGGYSLTRNSAGIGSDIFVAKLSSYGSWQWAVEAGGPRGDVGKSIAVDGSGNTYITGYFYAESATFGSISITPYGGFDGFVAKLSSSGSWQWAINVGSTGGDQGNAITVDSSGNSYITGEFAGTATFGSTTLISEGNIDVYVGKLSSSGSWVWITSGGGSKADRPNTIALDPFGNVYITGFFNEYATFGPSDLIGGPTSNLFVATLSSDSGLWYEAFSSEASSGTGIDFDYYGNIYIGAGKSIVFTNTDADGDNVPDINDIFVYEGSQFADQDGDGFGDNTLGYHGDSCPTVFGNSWQDRWGCPDMDFDGQSDLNDAYMQNPTQWNDSDGDGLGDNWDGTIVDRNGSTNGIGEYWPNAYLSDPSPLDYDNDGFEDENLAAIGASGPFDDCQLVYGLSSEDRSGCVDSDSDGWSDIGDSHPGDGTQHNDSDGDGYGDDQSGNLPDDCPSTWGNSSKDVRGCTDNDGDGWSEAADFDDTNPTEWGIDSDDDGIRDELDDFPNDDSQWSDNDGDGYGDNQDGTNPDGCPSQIGASDLGLLGCPDTDRDGWGDVEDIFPADPTQHSDSDGDGYGDSENGKSPDSCPEIAGNSTKGDINGCLDSDGDGWADIIDQFPTNNNVWSDSDGDGFSDQGADDCPNLYGLSNKSMFGCPDLDSNGLPDILDPDIDGDGILNTWEYQTDTDSFNASDYPADYDKDGIPNKFDEDDDGDGFPDYVEAERGSDPLDGNVTPFTLYGEQSTGFFYTPGEGFSSQYDPDGFEISVSIIVKALTTEFLIPVIMIPITLIAMRRKKRRYKKTVVKLTELDNPKALEEVEEYIDDMILNHKVAIEHGVVLRNMFERKRDELLDDSSSADLHSDFEPLGGGRRELASRMPDSRDYN